MNLEIYIDRMRRLDKLIKAGRTGPPAELAANLNVSESCLYEHLNAMRRAGAPIAYSKQLKTYLYRYQVEFSYGFRPAGASGTCPLPNCDPGSGKTAIPNRSPVLKEMSMKGDKRRVVYKWGKGKTPKW